MTPTIITLAPGVQFIPEAAQAFIRATTQVKKEFGRDIDVNSTYRSWDQQMAMYNAWNWYLRGGPYPGHSKAIHPSQSRHTGGTALDSDDWTNKRIVEILADNGFIRNQLHVPNEQHHFEWLRNRDNHLGEPISGGQSAPAPVPATPEEEEDEMPKNVMHHHDHPTYKYEVSISNPDSGFYLSYVTNDPETNNQFAKQYETGDSVKVSDSMFRVIAQSCAATRPQTSIKIEVANADE